MSLTPVEMSLTPVKGNYRNETYELLARQAWQNANGVSPFHIKTIRARGSKIFNTEFRKIYWKIGREEFPEKVLMIKELRDARYDFSDKTKSYTKSTLLKNVNRI